MDTDKLKKISELIRLGNKTEFDYQTIRKTIEEIAEINSLYLGDNLLKIICQGYCNKIILDSNGSYKSIFDQIEFDHRKQFIDLVLQKGIDKKIKFGKYSAPLLFYVEDKNLFEYLCSLGFDPNERLTTSGYEGRPYFSLHHDFIFDIFLISQKYGFNKDEETKNNDEIIHLIFNRFIDFETGTLTKLAKEFNETINIPMNSGLNCIQNYILRSDVSKFLIDNLKIMIESGFDINYKTQKDVELSEYVFIKGSSSLDIFRAKCSNYNFDKKLIVEIESLLISK